MTSSNLAEKISHLAYAEHPAGEPIPAPGRAYGGGFVGDIIPWLDGDQAIVVVSGPDGTFGPLAYDPEERDEPGAKSFLDGLANTLAIEPYSPLAQAVRAYQGGGFNDWHLPAHSVQLGLLAKLCPIWTQVEGFKTGQPNAYREEAHLSSTQSQFNLGCAWIQGFGGGHSDLWFKYSELFGRGVRIVLIRNSKLPGA